MIGADLGDIREGNLGLLSVMNQHFLVEIIEVTERHVRVSFAGGDYPVKGMYVDLEFHDKLGFNCYHSVVLEGPGERREGILLRRPVGCTRAQHRDSCRVPTDLTVQVKDQVHVRRYDAALLNVSGGGALLQTRAPFGFETAIEMTVSLPGEPTHTVLAQVVHVTEAHQSGSDNRLIGVRFVSLDSAVAASMARYIWNRLRELYPMA